MSQIKKWSTAIVILFLMTSCNNDNDNKTSVRDYATQYNEDIVNIENYLKTHSVTVTDNPGFTDDQNAVFSQVSNLDEASIWGSNPEVPKASLLVKNATVGGVVHKIYYLKFREGVGSNPTINNQITAYYRGFLLNGNLFDGSPETGSTFPLNQLINGWREIFPEFKSGIATGTNQYEDFGAGVMFLPSALGYYNNSPAASVPAYSPLVFSFKLYNVL